MLPRFFTVQWPLRGRPSRGWLRPTYRPGLDVLEDRVLLSLDPGTQFLVNSANEYVLGPPGLTDQGQPIVPLYTDFQAGGTYGAINSAVNVTLDGNDPDAGLGLSSFKMTWDGSGANGYFQFGAGATVANRPRDILNFGQAHAVRFLAKGDVAGRQLQVNVFRTTAGSFQQVASEWFTLTESWLDYKLPLPAGLRSQDLHAVQFLMDPAHDNGGGTVRLDEVRVDSDGFDPLRLVQSYQPGAWAPTDSPPNTPQGRDVSIYPGHSFLYDNSLAIKALLASQDSVAGQVARDIGAAVLATALPNGSYLNQRNSGHVLLGDGSVRPAFSQLQTLGDNSWFGLALLDLYRFTADANDLVAARGISDWAEANLKDGASPLKGYLGGYDDSGKPFPFRSTEMNIDFYELNAELARLLQQVADPAAATYAARATFAGDFVVQMFDSTDGKLWTGTSTGDTINTSSVPLDVQLWAYLTVGQSAQYGTALLWTRPVQWARTHLVQADGAVTGFTFSSGSTPNKVWLEGVGQGLVVDDLQGDTAAAQRALQTLQQETAALGGVFEVSSDSLRDPSLGAIYDHRAAVAATAWAEFGARGINPFAPLKTNPVITWANPADIVFGTPLSSTQLDATASVPGTFSYTPAAGTVLPAGNGEILSVTFTPTDTVDYNSATATAAFNVKPRPITAHLVKIRKKKGLIVEVLFADTGALKKEFPSPFQKPAFKHIQVTTIDSNGDGVDDEVVVTAKKGKRKVTATFPG